MSYRTKHAGWFFGSMALVALAACGAEGPGDPTPLGHDAAALTDARGQEGARIFRLKGPGRVCLDARKAMRDTATHFEGTLEGPVQGWSCAPGEASGFNQRWTLGPDGLLYTFDEYSRKACLSGQTDDGAIMVTDCNPHDIRQLWQYDGAANRIRRRFSLDDAAWCVTLAGRHNGALAYLALCKPGEADPHQAFIPEER